MGVTQPTPLRRGQVTIVPREGKVAAPPRLSLASHLGRTARADTSDPGRSFVSTAQKSARVGISPLAVSVQIAEASLKWVLSIRRVFLRTIISGPLTVAGESQLALTVFLGRLLTATIHGKSSAITFLIGRGRNMSAIAIDGTCAAAVLALRRLRALAATVECSSLVSALPVRGRLVVAAFVGQLAFAASPIRGRIVGPPSPAGSTAISATALRIVSLVADEADNYITDESGDGIILHVT